MSEPISITSSTFLTNAADLLERLQQDPSDAAKFMAAEAQQLVDVLHGWKSARPPNDVRFATIDRLFSLQRRALDYLAARGASGSAPPSRPPPAPDEAPPR